jgi:hypothetical protein
MARSDLFIGGFALALLANSAVCLAASSAASSASESLATSVGSISGSFETSSNSSTGNKTAQGDYRVVDVADAPQRPGVQRLALQSLDTEGAEGELVLYLPQQTVAQAQLAAGQVVTAKPRPYGVEFALRDTQEAFYLVLQDAWYRELHTQPVVL